MYITLFIIAIIVVLRILFLLIKRVDEIYKKLEDIEINAKQTNSTVNNIELELSDIKDQTKNVNTHFEEIESHIYDIKDFFDINNESLKLKRKIDIDSNI